MMTIKNKILAIFFAVSFNAFAAAWTGASIEPASTKTIDGKKFYVVSNSDELAWIAVQVNNGNSEINVILKNDIVLGQDSSSVGPLWTPIGKDSSIMFNGIFDGDGHTIYGLNINNSANKSGLFGVVGNQGRIHHLKIKSSQATSSQQFSSSSTLYMGILCGINNGVISDVQSDVVLNLAGRLYISLTAWNVSSYRGGLVGKNGGVLKESKVNIVLKDSVYVEHEYNAFVQGTESQITSFINVFDGGLSGLNEGEISLSQAYVEMRVVTNHHYTYSGTSSSKSKVYINIFSGQLCGKNSNLLQNNLSDGTISGEHIESGERFEGKNYCSVGVTDGNVGVNDGVNENNVIVSSLLEQNKTDEFAWLLNTTEGTKENSGVWSHYNNKIVFANDSMLAINRITFDDGKNSNNFYTNYKGHSDFPSPPIPADGKAFAGWFNSDGKEVNLTTIFLKDQTVTAKFLDWEDVVYSIRFLDENGKVLDLQSVHSSEVPVYGGSVPTKKATVAYTYSFAGWSPKITAATWHTDYRVLFDSTLNQYKVTYVDFDGKELFSSMFNYGAKPTYSTIPKKTNTVAYLYSFAGWSPTVENVSGEAVYKATYDSVLQKYTIEFKANGKSLLSKNCDYGSIPKYDGVVPMKTATKEYSYSFVGWTPEISKVTGATSYTAKFDSSLNKYMIVFQNGAKILQNSDVEYGKLPTYEGDTPQKISTAKYNYSFSKWSPSLTKVTGETTYTALFDSTLRSYEIAFVSEGKTLQSKEVEYGALPKFEGKDPSKKESKGYTYSFKGWSPSIAMVKEKAAYTAVFDSVARKFIVTFMNGKDTLQSSSVAYGKTPEYKGKTPTKSSSNKYEYKFAGWSPKIVVVTDKAVYKAVFDSTAKQGLTINRILANNFAVLVHGMQIQIVNAKMGSSYILFDLQGHIVAKGIVNQKSLVIKAKNRGRYIVRIGELSKNVTVR